MRLDELNRLRNWLWQRWNAQSLAMQFIAVGALVLLLGMTVIGYWVGKRIEDGVIDSAGAGTALYVDSVIVPLVEIIESTGTLTAGATRALEETLSQGALRDRIRVFKIWGPGGVVTFSTDPTLVGQTFEQSQHLLDAWGGTVVAEYNQLEDAENTSEQSLGVPLLEIYSPIRQAWSGKVVAVAEFYEVATDLEATLASARTASWLFVGAVTTAMLLLLYGIVRQGSLVIVRQRKDLEQQVRELSDLLEQNRALRASVVAASDRTVALNEQFLRRISADLHDGPAQLLALALMRFGSPAFLGALGSKQAEEATQVRSFLTDAMNEIRQISRGLALPQIEMLGFAELLRLAVTTHEARTGATVYLDADRAAVPLDASARICIFRCVQEALNNASRHAGGVGLAVRGRIGHAAVTVDISDSGAGFEAGPEHFGLGLTGMRERVESLGGQLTITSSPAGSKVRCTLPLKDGQNES